MVLQDPATREDMGMLAVLEALAVQVLRCTPVVGVRRFRLHG